MSHELRFQVEILPDLEWSALLERFRDVEALGFDLAVTADGFVDSMNPSRPWFDLWTLLAGVAQATHRIRIAPCVAQIPLRDPATFARQVLTLDHISNGRVEVGLGLGRPVGPSYRMMGIPNWDNPSARNTHSIAERFTPRRRELSSQRSGYGPTSNKMLRSCPPARPVIRTESPWQAQHN